MGERSVGGDEGENSYAEDSLQVMLIMLTS